MFRFTIRDLLWLTVVVSTRDNSRARQVLRVGLEVADVSEARSYRIRDEAPR